MHGPWLLLAAALAAAGCTAEERACTLIGCESFVLVELPDHLEPGAWRFELVADGTNQSCEAMLPLGAAEPTCSSGELRPVVDQSRALPTFEAIQLLRAPAALEVIATRNAEEVARQSFAPDYDELFPNGRECDEVPCLQADVQLDATP